jgi:hypothetical protein
MTIDPAKLEKARNDYLAGKYKSIRASAVANQVDNATLLRYLDKVAN